jgi:hypothetical protein
VSQLLDSISIELTGKLGSQLSKLLYLPLSSSTVTRIALRHVLPAIKQPVILGVDDWAFRKGVNYGTVLIDMETSRPIDLLSSRDSANLKEWLKNIPQLKLSPEIGLGHILQQLMKSVRKRFKLLIGFTC